jgi:hypothetical protein
VWLINISFVTLFTCQILRAFSRYLLDRHNQAKLLGLIQPEFAKTTAGTTKTDEFGFEISSSTKEKGSPTSASSPASITSMSTTSPLRSKRSGQSDVMYIIGRKSFLDLGLRGWVDDRTDAWMMKKQNLKSIQIRVAFVLGLSVATAVIFTIIAQVCLLLLKFLIWAYINFFGRGGNRHNFRFSHNGIVWRL